MAPSVLPHHPTSCTLCAAWGCLSTKGPSAAGGHPLHPFALYHPIKIPPGCRGSSALSSFLGTQRMHFSWLCLWHCWGHQPCHQSLPALVPGTRVQQHLHPPQLYLAGVTTGRSKGGFSCLLSALAAPVPTHSPIPAAVLAPTTTLIHRRSDPSSLSQNYFKACMREEVGTITLQWELFGMRGSWVLWCLPSKDRQGVVHSWGCLSVPGLLHLGGSCHVLLLQAQAPGALCRRRLS